MKLLGEKIWRLREKRGLSQEEFAELLGVSRQTVSNWENDRATPDAYKLKLLCEVLQVSADELLETGAEPRDPQETAAADPQESKTFESEEVDSVPPEKGKSGRTVFAVLLSVLAAALVVVGIILIALPDTGHGGASSVVIFTPTFGGIVLCVLAIGLLIPALLLFFKRK